MSDKAREEFEFWASDEGAHPDAVERSGEYYILAQIQAYWVAWLAAKEKYEPRWIRCEDRLPDCIGSYLIFGSMTDTDCNHIAWAFFNSAGEWCDTQGYLTDGVTHWMPLPPAPSTQGGGE